MKFKNKILKTIPKAPVFYYYYWRRNIYRVKVEEERDALRIIATNDESLYYP